MSTAGSVPGTSTPGRTSLCVFCTHQHQPRGAASNRGSIHAVRPIQDKTVDFPCSAAFVSESEEPSTGGCGCACEKSEISPCSVELVFVSEESTTNIVNMCEKSEIVVSMPIVVPSLERMPIAEETPTDEDLCEHSDIRTSIHMFSQTLVRDGILLERV